MYKKKYFFEELVLPGVFVELKNCIDVERNYYKNLDFSSYILFFR
jgi:hypothetical protein